jgi:hypothetical protein
LLSSIIILYWSLFAEKTDEGEVQRASFFDE